MLQAREVGRFFCSNKRETLFTSNRNPGVVGYSELLSRLRTNVGSFERRGPKF